MDDKSVTYVKLFDVVCLHIRYNNNIRIHTQKIYPEILKTEVIGKKLPRDIQKHLKPKTIWNCKLLLGLIISTIEQLNSLFMLFPVQQIPVQKTALERPVTKQLSYSLIF